MSELASPDGGVDADPDADVNSDGGADRTATGPDVRRLGDWDAERLRGLADEYGTPLYVMDLHRVRENCAHLRRAFPDAEIRYAAKAHTGRAVLRAVRDAGIDIECASAGEVRRALDAGFDAGRVQYTAVNPPGDDLDAVVDWWRENSDLTVTAGARDTIERLSERGYDGRLCVRVNPGVGAGHHEKVRTGANAKFGVPYERVPEIVEDAADEFDVVGIHAHAGSGISGDDLAAHRELVRRMGDLARDLADRGANLEFVDVGGGFGVPYREEEPPLDLDAVADATRDALGDVDATLAVEPGRYVVADAGVLLTQVNTVKEAPETTVVGVDAGMTTLLRPAMYDAYHEIENLATDRWLAMPATVTGPICESADVLCEDRLLAQPVRGDVIAVGNAGAYGYEMASTYNSRPRPAEVAFGVRTDTDATRGGDRPPYGDATLVRRRERLDDLTTLETDQL